MSASRIFFEAGLVHVAVMALWAALLSVLVVRAPYRVLRLAGGAAMPIGGAALIGAVAAILVTGTVAGAMVWAAGGVVVALAIGAALPRLHGVGAIELAVPPLACAVGVPWTWLMIAQGGAPVWLLIVAAIAGLGAIVPVAAGFGEALARRSLLTHRVWRRPVAPLAPGSGARPKVSLHLPCYAEPPEIVIAVLERLVALDYPDFEIIVCDNNTDDEALWRPVARRCAELAARHGADRVRFYHVPSLPGAKAGALNHCLERTAPDAVLVGVIDADYLARPDFLSRLAGFFDDSRIGYVQTPHDYRDHAHSAYLRACYWEYMPSNKIELAGLNEYGAAYTIGTMCLIRADALRAAGGWAEWCLTEDSEVSVRIRALGYTGVYLRESFGHGLIPQTFLDYKKQRFRWTAGPVQQLRRHWRLYLPVGMGAPSAMDGWSRLLEALRGAASPMQALGTIAGLAAMAAMTGLAGGGTIPPIDLADAAWWALGLGTMAAMVRRWQSYRLSGCARVVDMLRGELARLSLTYVQMVAGLAGLSARPLAWRRTPKFETGRSAMRAFGSTLPETAIGIAHLCLLYAVWHHAHALGPDLALLFAIGCAGSAARFLAAPVMAWLGERDLAAAALPDRAGGMAPSGAGRS